MEHKVRLALTEQEGRRLRQVAVDRCEDHVATGLVERLHGGAASVVADWVVAEQDGDVVNRDEPIALRPAVEDQVEEPVCQRSRPGNGMDES